MLSCAMQWPTMRLQSLQGEGKGEEVQARGAPEPVRAAQPVAPVADGERHPDKEKGALPLGLSAGATVAGIPHLQTVFKPLAGSGNG